MSRTFAAAVALALSTSALALAPAYAAGEDERPGARGAGLAFEAETAAARALEQAEDALAGGDEALVASPTLALSELFAARPDLAPDDRERADRVLARPTQGPNDPNDDGYTVRSTKTCTTRICLHWVRRTADAPPSRAWVARTMDVLKRTWRIEVGKLGYRRPVKDGSRGGNAKFDVYLKDVGSEGYYGYCAPERRKPDDRWAASGYCVLDDDFARSQFGAPPVESLRVTAAHEFFHAIQFAYDYAEDRWLMEGSATWMEEQVADDVDDNRQYLRYGQLAQPADPLDLFRPSGFDQYGNWPFFSYLAGRFGRDVVRRVWGNASGNWRNHSMKAVRRSLPGDLTFPEVFRAYAAANTVPGRTYPEGGSWPSATIAATHTLTRSDRTASGTLGIAHLASRNVALRPGDALAEDDWRLRVGVDGPVRSTSPTAYLLIHRDSGDLVRRPVELDRDGDGSTVIGFSSARVVRVTITLANASSRFDCWEGAWTYTCQGVPKDDGKRYAYRVNAFRR